VDINFFAEKALICGRKSRGVIEGSIYRERKSSEGKTVTLRLCRPERAVSGGASVGIGAGGCNAEISKISESDRFAALQPRGWKASGSVGSYFIEKVEAK
jgi:hypothetical protein